MCSGCALQAAPALHLPRRGRRVPSLELGARYKPARSSGMYGAIDATLADPATGTSFAVREVALGAGYHLAVRRLALELGPRIGIGAPAFVLLRGSGFHTALELSGLYRLIGTQEQRAGFIPLELRVDLLVFARGGVWARPDRSAGREIWDATFGLGLRMGVASDLTGGDGAWETE